MRKILFSFILLVSYISVAAQSSSQSRGNPLPGQTNENQSHGNFRNNTTAPIVLRGTIILPAGVLKHGYVAIVNGRIASVSEKQPDIPGAVNLNTHGIILPGFVDVHNHITSNIIPRWRPT